MTQPLFYVCIFFILSNVLSLPVPCGQSAQILEIIGSETLGYDPCGGRVCQSKCSCGQYVYFNVDPVINANRGAKESYNSICVTDSINSSPWITTGRTGMRNRGKSPTGDFGFVYDELKKSLKSCGYYYNVQGFGRLYKRIYEDSHYKTRGRFTSRRKKNPAYFLATFAVKLKDFAKVCDHQSNWKSSLDASLNQKLSETKRSNAMDVNSCVQSQAERIKSQFKMLILQSHSNGSSQKREFCECSKLVSASGRTQRGRSTYPFKKYASDISTACKRKCSNILEFEYEE
eukprot:gene3832-6992_t